ncbi:hypothetical protein [Bacillus sp. V59.32b]|uniref:hypothetical protein n=1 Tax=Bacillus sp. V59.32b TaxID=1758642 RepID=UPI000E3E1494|nr:hypothetical protein [Bacillus sp. V59.32b]RFU60392.1 hypothetical protein D0463_17010 [Bacillus sp. V59.32b]
MVELMYEIHDLSLLIYLTYLFAPLLITAGTFLLTQSLRNDDTAHSHFCLRHSEQVNLSIEYTEHRISFVDWLIKQIKQLIKTADDDDAYFPPIYMN